MPWPQPTDYNAAIQMPALCFADAELRQGQVAGDLFGLPRPCSGGFADVYQVQGSGNQSWAVKCFTRQVHDLQGRYQAISDHLVHHQRAFMVDFRYLEQGIRVQGQWYPVLKMRWVEGFRLNEFVAEHLDRGSLLERLAQMWVKLAQELREAGMAHGDLQHGNVLLVPGSKSSSLLLRLIDYDGMFIPALAQQPSGEVGHPHYQHPHRLRDGAYNAEVDRFSHLVIYTALRCLSVAGKSLWQRYDNGENLLFREEDFRHPAGSELLRELWTHSDFDLRNLTGQLLLSSQAPLDQVPLLDELLSGPSVKPLTEARQDQVKSLLGLAGPPPLPSKPPPLPAPGTVSELDWLSSHRLPAFSGNEVVWVEIGLGTIPAPVPVAMTDLVAPKVETISLTTPPPLPSPRPGLLGRLGRACAWLLDRPRLIPWIAEPVILLILIVVILVLGSRRKPAVNRPNLEPSARGTNLPSQPDDSGEAAPRTANRVAEKKLLPELRPVDPLLLYPGQTRPLSFQIDRHGNREVLRVQLEDLPPGVSHPPLPLTPSPELLAALPVPGASISGRGVRDFLPPLPQEEIETHTLLVTAAPDAQPAPPRPVQLTLWRGEVKIAHQPLALTIEKPPLLPRFHVAAPPVAVIGQPELIQVEVERRGSLGTIEVRLEGLPEGVACEKAQIRPGTVTGTLELTATEEAEPGLYEVQLVGQALPPAGTGNLAETTLLLKVLPAPRRVEIPTGDGLALRGRFYPSLDGKQSSAVLLVHDLGQHDGEAMYARLARTLQRKGFVVLSFDLRGHGESKVTGSRPWKRHLLDLAAARRFLDLRNDAGEVNSSNLILIGAGRGAALAALWLASECHRYETGPRSLAAPAPSGPGKPEGRAVAAAVWLSIDPRLPGLDLPVYSWLQTAGKVNKIPMLFIHGQGDELGGRWAMDYSLRAAPDDSQLTQTLRVPKTSAISTALLAGNLPTAAEVVRYLDQVGQQRKPRPWQELRFEQKAYTYLFPLEKTFTAKEPGGRHLKIPLDQLGLR